MKLQTVTSIQFVKFAMIGALNTLVHYAIFIYLFRFLGVPLIMASIIGYLCGMLNSYILNRRYTFSRTGQSYHIEFAKFAVVNCASLLANVVALKLLVMLHMYPEVAQLFAIGLSVTINFSGNKWWTFVRRIG